MGPNVTYNAKGIATIKQLSEHSFGLICPNIYVDYFRNYYWQLQRDIDLIEESLGIFDWKVFYILYTVPCAPTF